MAKFYGKIGFAITSETSPGVWDATVIERNYPGEVIKRTHRYTSPEKINEDLNLSSSISIVADSFANKNLGSMKYVKFMGTNWKIESIEPSYPRLILNLGGVYNGPTSDVA